MVGLQLQPMLCSQRHHSLKVSDAAGSITPPQPRIKLSIACTGKRAAIVKRAVNRKHPTRRQMLPSNENKRSTNGQATICSVLLVKAASNRPSLVCGHALLTKSISTGKRKLGDGRYACHAAMPACSAGNSLVCQITCGKRGAKYTLCWPVPEPISKTCVQSAKACCSTSKMGA